MGFSREELKSFRNHTVPDLIGDDTKLLFVGFNPGSWTAQGRRVKWQNR